MLFSSSVFRSRESLAGGAEIFAKGERANNAGGERVNKLLMKSEWHSREGKAAAARAAPIN